MTKQITMHVDFCDECPMFDTEDGVCCTEDKKVEDRFEIPEWCPLDEL